MPIINKPFEHFNVITYTGNGVSGRTITGVGFQPDFVWIKARSVGYNHNIADAVRGANKTLYLNTTDAEATNNGAGYVSAFTSDGFTLTQGVDLNQVNANGTTYVAWCWKGGNGTVSNTSGSITSTVSANTSAGFSVVTFTGTGSVGTVGHGLGVAPAMIITKNRTQGGAGYNWAVYHRSLASASQFLDLNTTSAVATNTGIWNGTAPTSSVFSVGTARINNGDLNVAYCFSAVQGYSAFTSYTGNGSSDGTFVHLGFRPRFVMIKNSSATSAWIMYDTARDTSNVVDLILEAQSSSAEGSGSPFADIDFLSNGFKIRGTSSAINTSGNTYVVAAFAENPFKYSLGR
jgi:hypothetical protein